MKKHTFKWHGRKYYFLGCDEDGQKYYLEEAHFDCGWYWGIGYVESFTNNRNPAQSKDICTHSHFDYMIREVSEKKNKYHLDAFKEIFVDNPFTDREIWKIIELMNSAYTARKYSDMIYSGGSHVTSNPVSEAIRCDQEYERINHVVIPAIVEALHGILEGEGDDNETHC